MKKGQIRSSWKERIQAVTLIALTMTARPEQKHAIDWVAERHYSSLCKTVYRPVITMNCTL